MKKVLTPEQARKARKAEQVCYYILCIVASVICLFPFLTLLITLTRNSTQIISGFSFEVGDSFFSNISGMITFMNQNNYSMIRSFFNSLIISLLSTAVCIYCSAMAAYACHVYNFKGKKIFEKLILLLIIIPGQLGAVGFYKMVMRIYGISPVISQTYLSYSIFILPAMASASTVYFIKQYLKNNFSMDYVDAARMDGASEFKIFNVICLPHIKSALATMALFGIISSWNNFMGPLTFITYKEFYTLPQIVYYLTTENKMDYGAYYMAIFVSMLPMLIVYFFMSKIIMKGTAAGGIK